MEKPKLLPVPLTTENWTSFLSEKFLELQEILTQITEIFEPRHVIPPRPRDGDIAFADGTDWDPGFGGGYYFFAFAQWFAMFNVGPRRISTFTATGDYNKPTWLRHAIVIAKGGGGGGAAATASSRAGGGGGEGLMAFQLYAAADLSATETATIGAGGGAGLTGGTTTFSTLSAAGGDAASDSQGGSGGITVSGAAWAIPGARGTNGMIGSVQNGGTGGGNGGGAGGWSDAVNPTAGRANSGGGGGGGSLNGATLLGAAAGGSGFVVILEF